MLASQPYFKGCKYISNDSRVTENIVAGIAGKKHMVYAVLGDSAEVIITNRPLFTGMSQTQTTQKQTIKTKNKQIQTLSVR